MKRVARQAFAPEGRRSVATGGVSPAAKRAERNPWSHSHLNHPAPAGRRKLHVASQAASSSVLHVSRTCQPNAPVRRPSGAKGDDGSSTGSASGRSAATPLHPWLQPIAPPGRGIAPQSRRLSSAHAPCMSALGGPVQPPPHAQGVCARPICVASAAVEVDDGRSRLTPSG